MRIVNLAALAVIVGGGAVLARPAPASATYIDPWGGGGGSTYCCASQDAYCCSRTGCSTVAGVCIPLRA
jgi:hypothetical protein